MINPIIQQDADLLLRHCGFLKGKTILVTGAKGLLGGYLGEVLHFLGFHVTGMDNGVAISRKEVTFPCWDRDIVHADKWEECECLTCCSYSFDIVLHCASIASPKIYKQNPLATIHTNVKGTENVLRYVVREKSLMIHFSSSEVYGDPVIIPTPETYNGNVIMHGPRSCYDESKRLSEVLCYLYHEQEKARVRIVRPFNLYGPGYDLQDGRVIPALMRAAISGVPLPLFGDGGATRSFCYLRDALAQILAVAEKGIDGEVYNVGNDDEELSVFQLASVMKEVAYIDIDNRMGLHDITQPRRRKPDLTKILKIAPRPEVDLREGLKRTLRSYK